MKYNHTLTDPEGGASGPPPNGREHVFLLASLAIHVCLGFNTNRANTHAKNDLYYNRLHYRISPPTFTPPAP